MEGEREEEEERRPTFSLFARDGKKKEQEQAEKNVRHPPLIRSRFRIFSLGVVQRTSDPRGRRRKKDRKSSRATADTAPTTVAFACRIVIGRRRGERRRRRQQQKSSGGGHDGFSLSRRKNRRSLLFAFLLNVPAISEDRALDVKPVLFGGERGERETRKDR